MQNTNIPKSDFAKRAEEAEERAAKGEKIRFKSIRDMRRHLEQTD